LKVESPLNLGKPSEVLLPLKGGLRITIGYGGILYTICNKQILISNPSPEEMNLGRGL